MESLDAEKKKYGVRDLLTLLVLSASLISIFLFFLALTAFLTRSMSDDRLVKVTQGNKQSEYLYNREPNYKLPTQAVETAGFTKEQIKANKPVVPKSYKLSEMDFRQAIDPVLAIVKRCCEGYASKNSENNLNFYYKAQITQRFGFGSLLSLKAEKNKVPFVLMRCIRQEMQQKKLIGLREGEQFVRVRVHFSWKKQELEVNYSEN